MTNDKIKKWVRLNPEIVEEITKDAKEMNIYEYQVIERMIMLHYSKRATERMRMLEQNDLILKKFEQMDKRMESIERKMK